MNSKNFAWILAVLLFSSPAGAAVKVVTTVTDLAYAAREIGGEHVEVDSLLSGVENPHFVDARPDLVRKVQKAQVYCQVGLELEVGWAPKVLQRSGNADVQPGGKGFCELGPQVQVLQKPTGPVDRSMGDVHPFGNPHFWLSPIALADASVAIVRALSAVDPEHATQYEKNQQAFKAKMSRLVAENRKLLEPYRAELERSKPVIEYHQEYTYFFDAYGIRSFGSIEEKPGVPPSAARLGQVASQVKAAKVKFAIAAPYAPLATIHKFSELAGIPHATVPTSIRRDEGEDAYPKLQKKLVETVAQALAKAVDGPAGGNHVER